MQKIVFIVAVTLYCFIYLIISAKTNKPFKTIIFFAFMGLLGMVIVNLTSAFSGIYIPVNGYTVGVSSALGLPGTVGLLLIRLVFLQ